MNFFKTLLSRGYKGAASQYKRVADPVDFLANIVQIILFVGQVATLVLPIPALLVGYQSLEETAGPRDPLSFPFRLMMLVAIVAVLGWGLGFFIGYVTKRNAHGTVVIAAIVSIIWALMLLVVADGLATTRPQFPEFLMFVLVGLGLMLWLLVFQLRAERNYGNVTMVDDRALLIALFAGVTFIGALLINVSAGR